MATPATQRERLLGMIQKKYPNYHPVVAMADLAHTSIDHEIQLQCHKAIAKFVEPELRSVEIKGEGLGNTVNIITMNAEGKERNLMEEMADRRQQMLRVIDKTPEEIMALPAPEKDQVAA